MSNIPSTPQPPKKSVPPPLKEGELSPGSIAAKRGFTRAVSTDEEEATVSRAGKGPKSKEKEKPITDRSVELGKVTPEQTDLGPVGDQLLLDDVLGIIAKMSEITDVAAMREVSKSLSEIARTTDLKKLEEFSKTHQLSRKEKLALEILLRAAQNASTTTVKDIEKRTKIDANLTTEEALAQINTIEDNYKQVQQAYNDLLNNFTMFAPDAQVFLGGMGSIVALIDTGFLFDAIYGETSAYGPSLASQIGYAGVISEMVLMTPTILQYAAPAVAVGAALNLYRSGRIALFRTAATGIMDSLNKKLGLS